MLTDAPTARRARALAAIVAGSLVAAAFVLTTTGPADAADPVGTVTGTVWHDLDGDGVKESGEPGVANVVIARDGTSTRTVTGSDGTYRLTVPVGSTLSAITGWLPSACPGDLWCKAGRTKDQDFAVENQWVTARPALTANATTTGVDLGLAPDYGDPTGSSTSRHTGNDPGDGKARTHDLAVRHTYVRGNSECADPNGTRVCPIGATVTALGQIYNQGTAWVSSVRFVLTLPKGTALAKGPTLDLATPGTNPTRTGRTGTTADGSTWIEFQLAASVPPAGAVWFRSGFKVTGGPSSPKPYRTPLDHSSFLSITAVTPADNDSPLRTDPALGLDAGHNVNHPKAIDDDTSDATEWNVA